MVTLIGIGLSVTEVPLEYVTIKPEPITRSPRPNGLSVPCMKWNGVPRKLEKAVQTSAIVVQIECYPHFRFYELIRRKSDGIGWPGIVEFC